MITGVRFTAFLTRISQPVICQCKRSARKHSEPESRFKYSKMDVLSRTNIRPAKLGDISEVHALTEEVNWDYTIDLLKYYFAATRDHPEGFLVADLDGRVIGSCMAKRINDNLCFGGIFIVEKKYRGHGVGMRMREKINSFIGNRNFGVNVAEYSVEVNKKSGFSVEAWEMGWYQGTIDASQLKSSANDSLYHLLNISDVSLQDVFQYDLSIQPYPREVELQAWFDKPGTTTKLLMDRTRIVSYGCIQPSHQGLCIGPLYADNKDAAQVILGSLLSTVSPNDVIDLYSPRSNTAMIDIIKSHSSSVLPQYPSERRMYTKWDIPLNLDKVYAISCTCMFLI